MAFITLLGSDKEYLEYIQRSILPILVNKTPTKTERPL